MNNKIELTTVKIETLVDGVKLEGTLKYWGKYYTLKLDKPFECDLSSYHLQLTAPVKYVIKKSKNPTCVEIDLMEKAKEELKSAYNKKINTKGNK